MFPRRKEVALMSSNDAAEKINDMFLKQQKRSFMKKDLEKDFKWETKGKDFISHFGSSFLVSLHQNGKQKALKSFTLNSSTCIYDLCVNPYY
ncbi:hypothetical protein CEXT_603921 [Caerostris extrusa]|uniref:Uncharacterized protein n=1 Tax=Caerostris extrusa TaxID=172846 RepID=A0AAV4SZ09_CAEEX|nr:hypothetical protein CEXT_603921 [Caerostris extrusa]